MKTPPQPSPRLTGFTLIELLTVIAIIAILMGLLFPAINAVKENAKKTQAKSDVMQIVAAVKAYHTEYGKYPDISGGSGTAPTGDLIVGGSEITGVTGDNAILFNILRAIPKGSNDKHLLNPRQTVFFEGKSASNPDEPRAGFAEAKGTGNAVQGAYYDPWGSQYGIIIDSDYDNVIKIDGVYQDFGDDSKPRTGTGAFSLGKDKKPGDKGNMIFRSGSTVSDDVISWQ
jgi:prepilin-type N-terminal cleavage/methylation domain-containing protein